jgi:hypothetical protein
VLYQEDQDKLPAHRVGEVLRCAGANPSMDEVAAVVGSGAHCALRLAVSAAQHYPIPLRPLFFFFFLLLLFISHTYSTMMYCDELIIIAALVSEGMIEAGEFRGVMANLGDAFNSEEIGQLMLMSELNAEGKFAIDDIVSYGATYK